MKQTYFQMLRELSDYCPKDDMFTSKEEIEMLDNHFGLSQMTAYDLQNLRDMTVYFYTELQDNEIEYKVNGEGQVYPCRSEKFWRYNTTMQSVTAVIDLFKIRKGAEI